MGRYLPIFLLSLLLAGCGGEGKNPERLAKDISKAARGEISLRYLYGDHFDKAYDFTSKTEGLYVEEEDGATRLRLRKWSCTDDEPGTCDRDLRVPVEYVIRPELVDTASIKATAPDTDKGEVGHAVVFACEAAGETSCLTFAGIGGFGEYKTCEEEDCDFLDSAIKLANEMVAMSLGDIRAEMGDQTIECKNEKACRKVAAQFRELIDKASGRPSAVEEQPQKKKDRPSGKRLKGDAKTFDQLISELDDMSRGAEYVTYNNEISERTTFQGERIAMEPDGQLRIAIKFCNVKADVSDINDDRNRCEITDESGRTVTMVELDKVGPDTAAIISFQRNGVSLDPLGILALVDSDELDRLADSYVMRALCRDGPDCVVYNGETPGAAIYIPCRDKNSCERTAQNFNELVNIAAKPSFPDTVSAVKTKVFPITPIESEKDAKRAVKRIADGMSDKFFNYEVDNGLDFVIREIGAELSDPLSLTLETSFEVSDPNQSGVTTGFGSTVIDLKDLDRENTRVMDYDVTTGWYLMLSCTDSLCVSNSLGGYEQSDVAGWLITCKNEQACRGIAADLRGLAAFAAGTALPDDKPVETKSAADEKLSKAMGKRADEVNKAVQGAEIFLMAAEGPALRLLRSENVWVADDGIMTVKRRACLAVLAVDMPQGSDCRQDTIFRDYDLRIDLARLDDKSIDVREASTNVGERGMWIKAECAPKYACAKIIGQADAQAETQMFLQSYLESANDPKIRIPCTNEADCKKAAKALRGLVKDAKKVAAKTRKNTKRRRGGDLVGIWDFESPFPNGWVTEFRSDGTFVFTNPTSRTEGTYEAKDGVWSQSAPQFGFEDNGTYRFLDEDTIELTGRLGASVWNRRSDDG